METKATLYLGVDPKHYATEKKMIHFPLVKIVPRAMDTLEIRKVFQNIETFTHIIFTSKYAVDIFYRYLQGYGLSRDILKGKYLIAFGQITAIYMKKEGMIPTYIAVDETELGVVRLIGAADMENAHVLLPKSSSARPLMLHYFIEHGIKHQACILYDMYEQIPEQKVSLEEVDEVVFTNPLTVDAFFSLYDRIPEHVHFHPLTASAKEELRTCIKERIKEERVIIERLEYALP